MVAADARTAINFSLSAGNDHDAPQGRLLLEDLGPMPEGLPLLVDRAYEGDETRQLVLDLGMIPVVRPRPTGLRHGVTTENSIRSATKSNGSSEGSRDFGVSSPGSKN